MLRCVKCGCSRLDSEMVGCALCGGSPSRRSEPCHVSLETKATLLANAAELKEYGLTVELENDKALGKNVGFLIDVAALTLAVADSLNDGVLRKLVLFLRDKKIARDEILRLRLDEPEKISTYYQSKPPTGKPKNKPIRRRRSQPKGRRRTGGTKRRK